MRAKANPDPLVIEHTPTEGHGAGKVFHVVAHRTGAWTVKREGRIVHTSPSKLQEHWAGMNAPRYPSNRLQAEAIEEAKQFLRWVPEHEA